MVWSAYANARLLVVTREQAKEADKLEPKGNVAGRRSDFASLVDTMAPPAKRADLTHPVTYAEHGKPNVLRPR
jgi:hypothetical protein